jgi:hypothetical protein
VPVQRHYTRFPPAQIVNSAPISLTAACHFGGSNANCAIFATI